MVKVSEIKGDLDTLRASQVTKAGSTDPLLMGVMVNRQGELCTLTTFDGISCTTIRDRDWGALIPEGGFVLPAEFAQLFKELEKDAEVVIAKVKNSQVEVKRDKSKWCFPMSSDTTAFYPIGEDIISNKVASTSVYLDGELLKEAIVNVFPSMGEESTALCCAEFILNPQARELTVAATDLRRTTIWKAVNVKYPDLPLPEYRLLIPGQKLLALAKFVKDSPELQISFTESVIIFESPSLKTLIALRLLNDRDYPPVLNLFKLPLSAGYTIVPKDLIKAIKRVRVLLPSHKLSLAPTLLLKFENDNIQISHESELFLENVPYKMLEIEGQQHPKSFESALNIDYLNKALTPLTGTECDIKLHSNIVAVTSNALGGFVTHFIATVTPKKQLN